MSQLNRNNPNGSASSSSSARGRIAQVLAQARASLKDPSRPYTPNSLDQRTSIQSTAAELNMLNAKYASFNSSALANTAYSNSNEAKAKKSISKTHNILNENLRQNFGSCSESSYALSDSSMRKESNTYSDYDDNTPFERNTNKGTSKSSTKSPEGDPTATENDQYTSFKLLLTDVNDMLLSLEFESMGFSTDIPTSSTRVEEILNNLSSPISKLSKIIGKDKTTLVKSAKADVDLVGSALAMALFRVNDNEVWNMQLKQLLCRHVLRFYLSCLNRNNKHQSIASKREASSPSSSPSSTSVVLCSDVSNTLKRVTECLYQTRLMPSSGDTNSQKENRVARSSSEDSSDLLLSGGLVELLLELISLVCGRISTDIEMLMAKSVVQTQGGDRKSKNNTANQEQGTEGGKDFLYINETDFDYIDLLESAAFAAAIIRQVSGNETDRRRLQHSGAIDVLVKGLESIESDSLVNQIAVALSLSSSPAGESKTSDIVAFQLDAKSSKKKSRSGLNAPDLLSVPGIAQHRFFRRLLSKINRVLVQLVGVIRNFSNDTAGRTQLLSSKVVCKLCRMQGRVFKAYPELLLNCARTTAKLSLLDPFRSQINRQPESIKYLVEVIIGEAESCRLVMEGAGERYDKDYADEDEDKDEDQEEQEEDDTLDWPQWHTWPLLSRVCFTLGNLTTTNNNNRTLIGLECKVLKPLVLLLQACTGCLSQLNERFMANERKARLGGCDEEGLGNQDEKEEELEEEEEQDNSSEIELRDATVKLLRLLANLTIDGTIGTTIAESNETISILLELLVCSTSGGSDAVKEQEELQLNVIAACTNVTFYAVEYLCRRNPGNPPGVVSACTDMGPPVAEMRTIRKLDQSQVALSVHLSHCLFHENEEIVLETARVLGNLSRRRPVLQSLASNRTDEALLLLLQHNNTEIVSSVTGVLVNISADVDGKRALLKDPTNLFNAFSKILRRLSFKDLSLSTLVCQVLHNLLSLSPGDVDTVFSVFKSTVDVGLQQRGTVVPMKLVESLEEIVDCCSDMKQSDDDEYGGFESVGGSVIKLLRQLS